MPLVGDEVAHSREQIERQEAEDRRKVCLTYQVIHGFYVCHQSREYRKRYEVNDKNIKQLEPCLEEDVPIERQSGQRWLFATSLRYGILVAVQKFVAVGQFDIVLHVGLTFRVLHKEFLKNKN